MAFKPLFDTHAIQQVSFGLGLERELTETELTIIAENPMEMGHDFARSEIHDGFEMSVTTGGTQESPSAEVGRRVVGGVSLKTFRRDGNVEWEVSAGKTIMEAAITVTCATYTRWNPTWQKARNILAATLTAVGEPRIRWTGLEYRDVFVWEGSEQDCQAGLLFNKKSHLISTAMLNHGPVWHAHNGWFSHDGLPVSGHRLELLNVDALRQQDGQLTTQITSRQTHNFNEAMKIDALRDEGGDVLVAMTAMHDNNKSILGKLLTQESVDSIYLNVRDEA